MLYFYSGQGDGRGLYLNTINTMADRATSTSLEALVRQPPPPQQALTAPPQPASETSRSMGLNRLEQDIVARTVKRIGPIMRVNGPTASAPSWTF